jgi:hypothetical protein
MSDSHLLLFAEELRDRAKQILVCATSTEDPEVQSMRRVIAAGYEKLARAGPSNAFAKRTRTQSPQRVVRQTKLLPLSNPESCYCLVAPGHLPYQPGVAPALGLSPISPEGRASMMAPASLTSS